MRKIFLSVILLSSILFIGCQFPEYSEKVIIENWCPYDVKYEIKGTNIAGRIYSESTSTITGLYMNYEYEMVIDRYKYPEHSGNVKIISTGFGETTVKFTVPCKNKRFYILPTQTGFKLNG